MAANHIEIEHRKVSELKPYAGSARTHTAQQRRKARSILARFGQIAPVIVDEHGSIIDGHMIVEELAALGYDEIAVIVVRSRGWYDVRALRLALNRLALDTKIDRLRLKAEFETLLEVGYDLSFSGFDAVEIDSVFAVDEPGVGALEAPPPKPAKDAIAVSRAGDLVRLGGHRVLCGDARDAVALSRLMVGETARMAFLDVPYNSPIAGFVSSGSHREFAMASGEMTGPEFAGFLEEALRAACCVLCDGAILYACIDWRGLMPLTLAAMRAGLAQLNLCVWAKTNAGQGAFYRSQHELIPVFKKGTAPHQNNFGLGAKGRSRSNVWWYRGQNVVGGERDELLLLHPTVKPLALVQDALKDVSGRGDIVLDTFLGSGTTLIAAEETGRRCCGMEIDPLYLDVIVRRWQAHTGKAAVFETGERFDDRESTLALPGLRAPLLQLPAPTPGRLGSSKAED